MSWVLSPRDGAVHLLPAGVQPPGLFPARCGHMLATAATEPAAPAGPRCQRCHLVLQMAENAWQGGAP